MTNVNKKMVFLMKASLTLDGELRTLVAVTREGGFVRSGPEVTDEVLITYLLIL